MKNIISVGWYNEKISNIMIDKHSVKLGCA